MAGSGANCLNKKSFSSNSCNFIKASLSSDEMECGEESPSLLSSFHSLPNKFFNQTIELDVSSNTDDQLASMSIDRPAVNLVKIYPDIFTADSDDDSQFELPVAASSSSHRKPAEDKMNKFEHSRTDISGNCASLILSNDSDTESEGKPAANCSDSSLKENNLSDVNENCKTDRYSKFLGSSSKGKLFKDVNSIGDRSNVRKISLQDRNSNTYQQQSAANHIDSDGEEASLNISPLSLASSSQSQLPAAVRKANNTLSNLKLIHPDIFSADTDSDSEEESFKPLPVPRTSISNRSKSTCPSWRRKRTDVASTSGRSAFNRSKKVHVKDKNKSPQNLARLFPDTFSIYSDSEDEQPGSQTPKRRRDNDLKIIPETPSSVVQHNKRPRPSISMSNSTTSASREPAYSNVFSFSLKMSNNFNMGACGEPDSRQNESNVERCRESSTSRSSDSSSTDSSNSPASCDDLIVLSDDTSRSSSDSSQDNYYRPWTQIWHRRRHFHRATRQVRRGLHRQGGNSPSNQDGFVDDPVELVTQVQDDEEYARQLQAEFDAEAASHSPFRMTTLPSPPRYYELPPWNLDSPVEGDQPRGRPSRRRCRINNNGSPGGLRDLLNFSWLRQNHPSSGRRRSSRRGRHRSGTYDASDYEELLRLGELLGETPKRTLSRAQIERLPIRQYVPGAICSGDDNVCSVCMSPYEPGHQLRILPCFHEFHKTCIDPWIKNNPTCPICRVEVQLN